MIICYGALEYNLSTMRVRQLAMNYLLKMTISSLLNENIKTDKRYHYEVMA